MFQKLAFRSFLYFSQLIVPKEKLECKFSRSSGPGGQHVNKTNSKAEIRFNIAKADWMQEEYKKKFIQRFPTLINKEGEVIITSQISREQNRNLEDAIERLQQMVDECTRPEKKEFVIPPPSENRIKRRVEGKRQKSDVKKTRQMR